MAAPTAAPPRPGLPSPAVARYGAILLLLAAAGLFAGQGVYNATRGPRWLAVVQSCAAGRPLDVVPDVATGAAYLRCVSAVEQERAGFTFAGALAVLLLGAVLMLVLPHGLLWRARPLRPAGAEIAGRVAEAALRLGLRRPPAALFGGWRLQEPFTVRTLRGIRVILPRGLRRLPPEQIDAILRHEAAHVRAGDVTLVWLTRGMWWALIPALLTPPFLINGRIVLAHPAVLAEAPLELLKAMVSGPYYWNYSVRSLLLLAVATTVAAAVLRSREHEADLAAAAGGRTGLLELLRDEPSPRRTWWRRLRAIHPSARRRLAALGDPDRTMELRPLDAAAAAVLIAMMTPVLHLALPANPANGLLARSTHLTGVVSGILFALVWGTAQWRAALVAERTGRPMRLRATSTALAAATAAGLLTHISGGPTLGLGAFDNPTMLALLPPSVGAAAAASGLLARAWARGAAGAPVAGATWAGIAVLNTLMFSGALWISCDTFALVQSAGGWVAGVRGSLGYYATHQIGAGTVVALWVLALRWARDRSGPSRVAFLVIVPAAAALAARWLVFTDPTDQLNALHRDFWAMTAAGGAVVAVLLARRGAAGLVPAMTLAPAATLLVAATIWLRYLPAWNYPGAAAGHYLTAAFAVLAPVYLLAALVALLLPARR